MFLHKYYFVLANISTFCPSPLSLSSKDQAEMDPADMEDVEEVEEEETGEDENSKGKAVSVYLQSRVELCIFCGLGEM